MARSTTRPIPRPSARALDALNGWDPTGGCLYYYNPRKTDDEWIRTRTVKTVIGNHYFAVYSRALRGTHMQTSRTRDRDYLRAALVGACALLAALAVLIFKQAGDVRSLNARLSAVYQKAFYETCELMEGMSTNLRKLLVTGSAQQEQVLLSEIARQAQGAQDDLSQLPLGEEAVSATIKFVNQAGDFATSLAGKLAGGAAHQRRGL